MKKLILILLIIAFPILTFGGDFSKVGTAAAQFLKIGVGARAMSLGGTFTAIASDVSTIYWNPAGITNLKTTSLGFTHTQWFADISHDFAGVSVPLSSSDYIAVSATSLSTSEQEVTTIAQPNGTGVFYNVSDLAIGLTYARQLTDRFSVGLSAKYIQQTLFNEKASSLTLDIGSYLRTGFHNLIIGMAISNFGGSMQLDGRDLIAITDINKDVSGSYTPDGRLTTQEYALPLIFRVGLSMDIVGGLDPIIASEESRFTFAVEGTHLNDNNERVNIGTEYAWSEMVFARAGFKFNYDQEQWTFGAGLNIPLGSQIVIFDYAFIQFKDLGNVSQFSLELRL
ncbi:MAG: PorV/PorQ family protein [Melioribacteraceae bacterium]|nr:PorV/PorQ family protein [Melioribacteraceae bacterium]